MDTRPLAPPIGRPVRVLLALALAACLGACATPSGTEAAGAAPGSGAGPKTVTVRGDIVQRDRKPLPADAEVRVWLDHADNPTPLAEQVFRTEGRQWPIPFALSIDPARVEAGRSYRLRVIVKSDGRIQYVTGGRVNVAPDKVPDGLAILVVPGETERLFQETEAPFRLGPGSRSPSRGEGRPREGR